MKTLAEFEVAALAVDHQRQRDKSGVDVAGSGVLPGLGDVVAEDGLRFHLGPDAQGAQRIDGRQAVGCDVRVGDSDPLQARDVLDAVDREVRRPKDQAPAGVARARAGD